MYFQETEKRVLIGNGNIAIAISFEWFQKKYPQYSGMSGGWGRNYEPNERHFLIDPDGELVVNDECPTSWTFGDEVIANAETIQTEWLNYLGVGTHEPKWKQFRMFFLSDIAYSRMRFSNMPAMGQITGGRIEAFINIESEEWETLAGLWAVFADFTPVDKLPSLEEVNEWKAQAASALMPFTFSDDGKLILIN